MTFAPTPRPRSIKIDRVEIDVRGVDASIVQAALNALPAATARALEGPGANATTKLGMRPSVDDVARAIASQIATTVTAHRRQPESRSDDGALARREEGSSSAAQGSFASLRTTLR